jgi:putative membrane protein
MIRSALLAAAAAIALSACGQTTAVETPPPVEAPPAAPAAAMITDADFATQVAASDAFEIQAAQLAATKASAANVKSFAQMMVRDHTATSAELSTTITGMGQTPPAAALTPQQQADLDALRALSGAAFDTAYVQGQVAAHQGAVTLFQNYIAGAPESALKNWANTTLPKLQGHLTAAQGLATPTTP